MMVYNISVSECDSDTDWASSKVHWKSISGWLFMLGEAVIVWSSNKQTRLSMSLMESKYVTMSVAGEDII